ncbi:MAG: S8 family serine peptidase [Raineya sp.]
MKQKYFILFFLTFSCLQCDSQKKIRVSIWELYDVRVFPSENIYKNPRETPNGKDDDRNGFVDDIYGIGFDYQEQPTNHNYTPDYDSTGKILNRYFHGTAVTNILLRNNPDVELVGVGFLKYVDRPSETHWLENLQKRLSGKPEEDIALLDNMFRVSVAYFKAHNVKVVNISWGAHVEFLKKFLKELDIYSEENFKKMQKWTKLFHKSLYKIFKENPDIFFVIAAGNDNQDVDKPDYFYVPGNINLPNTLVVGGIDKNGEKTSFSNYGKNVKVYATSTYENLRISSDFVLSYGEGTSFAAPVVTAYVARRLADGKNFKQIKQELIAKKYIFSK